MVRRALARGTRARQALATASEVLGEDLERRFAGPDGVRPRDNRDVQLSVFLTNHLHLLALQDAGIDATLSLGLSLGEYNHLVHVGAIAFEDAVRLVSARGEAYDAGPRGMMVAIVGPDAEAVDAVARAHGVAISNYNGPTQHVIAGPNEGVEAASAVLEDEHYAMTFVIERHVPMHSPTFEAAAAAFEPVLRAVSWSSTSRYFPNVEGAPRPQSTAEDIVASLRAHVSRPVQWARSMDWIATHHSTATLIEVGPGRVLFDLARRGWPQLSRLRTDEGDPARMGERIRDAAR